MKSIHALSDLSGRTALITGAAGHLGTAFAGAFAELGAKLVLVDRYEDNLASLSTSLRNEYGIESIQIVADLEQEDATSCIAKRLHEMNATLDILVNNAAFVGTDKLEGWCVPFANQTLSTWNRVFQVNLASAFSLLQALAPLLEASGRGSVINISSIYGVLGPDWRLYEGTDMGNPAAYAASKGGLLQLTRWAATTLAPRIRVNCLTLGGILRGQQAAFLEKYEARTPLRRMGREEDIIGAAVYLASDLSSYVTGHNLIVDGGWSSW